MNAREKLRDLAEWLEASGKPIEFPVAELDEDDDPVITVKKFKVADCEEASEAFASRDRCERALCPIWAKYRNDRDGE